MKNQRIYRALARLSFLALAVGAFGAVDAVTAGSAEAAACSYSNLTSTSVKNVNCTYGAYGYKASATATVGTRVGAWVTAGRYSYNPNLLCYAFPTMVRA